MEIPLTVLGILDGFGFNPQEEGNAVIAAKTPNLDLLWSQYPHFLVKAAEEEVGLSFGEVGNSEVGHITIGTGRVIPQNLSLINKAIDDGSFFQNKALRKTTQYVRTNQSNLHIHGIVSTAGVHGHLYHFLAILRLADQIGIQKTHLHIILDGRDSGPRDAPYFLKEINQALEKSKSGKIASIAGRAFSMDRNNNWERTKLAYDALMGKSDYSFQNADEAVKYFYSQGLDDENIPPTLIVANDQPPASIKENDAVIITNFREDRARQITKSLCLPGFNRFDRPGHPQNLMVATMTSYEKGLPVEVAFPPPPIYNTLSDVISQNQIPQIHIAETEKYAHVTYFFNGGREAKRPQEEYFLIPSLKPEDFATHPEMSAAGVTKAIIDSINLGYKFIVFNFANCDMIGHTGIFESVTKAIEHIDQQIKLIWDTVSTNNGNLLITADHGNAEQMTNPKTKAIYKEHTISPVPLIIANQQYHDPNAPIVKIMTNGQISGLLSDIAPTILSLVNLPVPEEMTGTSLIT